MTIWTVGHSTHSLVEFIAILRRHEIAGLADVRRYPGSKRHPHFSAGSLADALPAAGIGYHPFTELGGMREAKADSANTAWKNVSFRGYADYMETAEFRAAIDRLMILAGACRTAIMCAEADWRHCHRSLISDFLKADRLEVLHIPGDESAPKEHPYTEAARVADGRLLYREATLFD